MRKLIALVFHYSLNGLLADRDTEHWDFCFELLDQHGGPDQVEQSLDFLQGAYAHVMGRNAYEGMAANLPSNPDHPWADIMNAGRKVVFSRTLKKQPSGTTPPSPLVIRRKRSTSSGKAGTATSWSGAASASGGRSCSST
jgi:dihydrofolate reductase